MMTKTDERRTALALREQQEKIKAQEMRLKLEEKEAETETKRPELRKGIAEKHEEAEQDRAALWNVSGLPTQFIRHISLKAAYEAANALGTDYDGRSVQSLIGSDVVAVKEVDEPRLTITEDDWKRLSIPERMRFKANQKAAGTHKVKVLVLRSGNEIKAGTLAASYAEWFLDMTGSGKE